MGAITKAFTVIADSAVDPDSPLDSVLMTALRDRDIYLFELLGGSFAAGHVQDHDHDGVNSARVPIGPNYVRNSGFEINLGGWTVTQYTGGTVARETGAGNFNQGVASLAITSTVLANGGGDALQSEFVPVNGGKSYPFSAVVKASVANVSSRLEVHWYDSAQALISTSTVYTHTNTPTTFRRQIASLLAPSTARFARCRLTGGVPGSGTATGSIYFDDVSFGEEEPLIAGTTRFINHAAETSGGFVSPTKVKEVVCPFTGRLSTAHQFRSDNASFAVHAQVYINGVAAGTDHSTTATSYQSVNDELDVKRGDLVQIYAYKEGGATNVFVQNFELKGGQAMAPVITV